jgi:hypothetical protein
LVEGFDVVMFSCRNLAECLPLSCNHLAEKLPTNPHCLFNSFREREMYVTNGTFNDSEPWVHIGFFSLFCGLGRTTLSG